MKKNILSKQEKVSEWDDMNVHNDEIYNKSKIFDISIIQNDEIGKKLDN